MLVKSPPKPKRPILHLPKKKQQVTVVGVKAQSMELPVIMRPIMSKPRTSRGRKG